MAGRRSAAATPATPAGRRRARRSQRGAVTAETVMVLPVLVAVTIGLCWLLALGIDQARVVDAARETARSLARDDPRATAVAAGARVAPEGASIEASATDEVVTVTVTARVDGPGGLFDWAPSVALTATATAQREQQ